MMRARLAHWCALLLCLLALPRAYAAITVDNTATTTASAATSLTWLHTVGSGADRILIVAMSYRTGNVSSFSVKYGGTSLTSIADVSPLGNQNKSQLWYLLAPPVGTANVTVTWTTSAQVVGASVSYTGVDQTSPLGLAAVGASIVSSQTASVTVVSGSGQLVVDCVSADGDAISLTSGGSQTQKWSTGTGTAAGDVRGGGSTQPGALATIMTWTLGANTQWSIAAVPLMPALVPGFTNLKTVQIISDPVNGTTNPKYIPGAIAQYTVTITNDGSGSSDSNSVFITDPVPTNTKLYVNDIGGAGSGPVSFSNGSPSSGLTYTFTSLGSGTDDLSFSNNGGLTWTYTPTAGADGCDANVTNIQVNPKGAFAGSSTGNPSFSLSYRVCIK